MKAAFYTLGCKVNQYDTQAMRELFEDAGYQIVAFDQLADVYVINTCTVTQMGDKKSRQMVSRAHAQNPTGKIIVAGCYSQRVPEEVRMLPGVNLVVGTGDRGNIVALAKSIEPDAYGVNHVHDVRKEAVFEPIATSREGRTRAHLKIQDGCNRYCAYCIIPYTRGPLRSRPLGDVQAQMKRLAQNGYCEIVLTGIHLMSYGVDFADGTTLLDAIAQAEGVDGIQRIRLGSLEPEPQLLSERFIWALRDNSRICRQFHLSLQSGSKAVLARMNRRYTPEEYALCLKNLRSAIPGCAVTTDIIVGFPGETEEEFSETMDFARRMEFSRIHVFPYSKRAGTAAYGMPVQVPRKVKVERAARLIALGEELERAYMCSMLGSVQSVLFEEEADGKIQGYTDTYVHVRANGFLVDLAGKVCNVKITGMCETHLSGEVINE